MAVPKKRHSNTRTNMRRATWKLEEVNSGKCPSCGAPTLPHHACKKCGTYKGRTVLVIKEKKSKKELAKAEKAAAKEQEQKEEKKDKKKKEKK